MHIINCQQLELKSREENESSVHILEHFVEEATKQVSALQEIVMTEGASLHGESVLNQFLTAASSVGAERLALVARRVSIAFQDGNPGRAAVLLNQVQWELDAVTASLDQIAATSTAA